MEAIIFIIIGLALAGGAFYAYRAGKKQPKALPRNSTRTLLNIQVNDIVSHFTRDYLVEGKMTYNDDGDEWYTYMLVDGDDTVWLSVEEDDRLEASLYRDVSDLSFSSRPPEHVEYDGARFELEEWGRAKVSRVGQTGDKKGGTLSVTYYDYEAPGGRYLSVEQWGEGEFEVSVGESVRPNELEILPGDEVS